MDDDYVKNLESVIRQMLRPLKDIPLSLVIESISGHKVTPFNPNDARDKALLSDLIKVARLAGSSVNKEGISRPRPNEVGNDIEILSKML